jgi:endonuclease YncB( thermonuclease family)
MPRASRMPRALVITAVVALSSAACGGGNGSSSAPTAPGTATIARVVDGDTIRVHIGGREERVRLVGIDTPESVKPGTPVQCYALAASARTKALLPKGSAVRLVRDVEERDRYGRLLAYVYRARDDLFVNLALVREGYAVALTVPPNVAHTDELVAAARDARDHDRGLWSRCEAQAVPNG